MESSQKFILNWRLKLADKTKVNDQGARRMLSSCSIAT